MTAHAKNMGGMAPCARPGYTYGSNLATLGVHQTSCTSSGLSCSYSSRHLCRLSLQLWTALS